MVTSKFSPKEQTLRLNLPSDLRSTTVEPISREIQQVLEASAKQGEAWMFLHLDLTEAKMIDSAGLNLIVSLIRLSNQRKARVRISVSNPHVHRTFTFTRLDRQVDLELLETSPLIR